MVPIVAAVIFVCAASFGVGFYAGARSKHVDDSQEIRACGAYSLPHQQVHAKTQDEVAAALQAFASTGWNRTKVSWDPDLGSDPQEPGWAVGADCTASLGWRP